jgi:hypothetical protein
MVDVEMALAAEDVERIRQGYVCIRCLEPQSVPFPEICESRLPNGARWCNFPIKEKQLEEFAAMYHGEVSLGSKVNLNDEVERLTEIDKYEARTGIILPDHIKFPQGEI